MTFRSLIAPADAVLERMAERAPENPFFTPSFARAQSARGRMPVALVLDDGGGKRGAGCVGFLAGRWFDRVLEIPSLPDIEDPEPFWGGLLEACRERRVSRLEIHGYGSDGVGIPAIADELWRRARREYRIDLGGEDLLLGFSSNHRRNIRKATKAGLRVRRGADREACEAHVELVNSSRMRRRRRGESVGGMETFEHVWPLPGSGAGRFYQAEADGRPVSSVLVLEAERGAYYQSAGTSPEGMETGASHFLVYRILETFRAKGHACFNLAGAGPHEVGLARFKAGFGGRPVELEAVSFALAGRTRRRLLGVLRRARQRLRSGVPRSGGT